MKRIYYGLMCFVLLLQFPFAKAAEEGGGESRRFHSPARDKTFGAFSSSLSERDTLYVFRFPAGSDAFLSTYKSNGERLDSLVHLMNNYREEFLSGNIPVRVDGYCASFPSRKENIRTAARRSNRVKSELIVRAGLKEECFVTHNHTALYENRNDAVTVSFRIPTSGDRDPKTVIPEKKEETPAVPEEKVTPAPDTPVQTPVAKEEAALPKPVLSKQPVPVSFRANLLRWATLTPDLGIEWRIDRQFGILLNGSWTSWSWDDKERRYALWNVSPEVRYYFGKRKRGYGGVAYRVGAFNYKLGATGRQGDYMGGGITGGYLWEISPRWGIDFRLSAGYTRAKYEEYRVIENVRVRRQGERTKNYWGIDGVGVTLVWNIGGKAK